MKKNLILALAALALASCGGQPAASSQPVPVSSEEPASLPNSTAVSSEEPVVSSEEPTPRSEEALSTETESIEPLSQEEFSQDIVSDESERESFEPVSEESEDGEDSSQAEEESSLIESEGSSEDPAYEPLDLKVVSPQGAPAVALYRYVNCDDGLYETNANPQNVVAYLNAASNKDIVIAPTNAGMAAIKKGAPYKIAATLTFGNFYLAGSGLDENRTLDPDDYVVVFQQNGVPDKVFQYVYGELGLTNVHYVSAAADAAQALITKKNISDDNNAVDYVFMAEPALTNALTKNPTAYQYEDMQDAFAKKSGGLVLTQASVFVSNHTDTDKVSAFLASLKKDIEAAIADPGVMDAFIDENPTHTQERFSIPGAAAKASLTRGNRMGLGFAYASEAKDDIENFISLFGINGIDETAYFVG